MNAALVLSALLLVGFIGLMIRWWLRRRESRSLDRRESLSDELIYERYYAKDRLPRGLVLQLWHEVSEVLGVPAPKLRPEDRFGKDIGAYLISSDDLDVLAAKGRERAKALGLKIDLEKVNTVDAYIRCFAVHVADTP